MKTGRATAVTRYVALVDGKAGAFGVVFPDCPGCTAMGRTVEEAVRNGAEALAEWADDVVPMPKPRTVAQVGRDLDVQQALARGDAVLVRIALVKEPPAENRGTGALRRRYA